MLKVLCPSLEIPVLSFLRTLEFKEGNVLSTVYGNQVTKLGLFSKELAMPNIAESLVNRFFKPQFLAFEAIRTRYSHCASFDCFSAYEQARSAQIARSTDVQDSKRRGKKNGSKTLLHFMLAELKILSGRDSSSL